MKHNLVLRRSAPGEYVLLGRRIFGSRGGYLVAWRSGRSKSECLHSTFPLGLLVEDIGYDPKLARIDEHDLNVP